MTGFVVKGHIYNWLLFVIFFIFSIGFSNFILKLYAYFLISNFLKHLFQLVAKATFQIFIQFCFCFLVSSYIYEDNYVLFQLDFN